MSERVCDECGKKKEVTGGKTCENGHFICKECVWKGTGGGFFGDGRAAAASEVRSAERTTIPVS